MKKVKDFKFPFYRFAGLNFYNCYASVYLFLQGPTVGNVNYNCRAIEGKGCNECWNCAESLQTKSERLMCLFATIFDGFWTTQRDSWSGEKTKIQSELARKHENFENKISHEVDILTNLTGYSFKKITEGFMGNIVSAIDDGKPVIAKIRNEETFRVIIGYDGDALIDPDYRPADSPVVNSANPTTYESIEYLYLFGKCIPQRYTFLDVLKNMDYVMSSDFAEGLWHDIVNNIRYDVICDQPFSEVKRRFERLCEIADMLPNRGHNLQLLFGDNDLLKWLGIDIDRHRELFSIIEGQGHLLHERGYMLTAISTSIINLKLDDTDKIPWDKHGLVTAAGQILELVINCDLLILQAIKNAVRYSS